MSTETVEADFIVVGAGIAGASVAAELAGEASVVLLERESQPGYHTTGRSAALFSQIYGPAQIRALTRAAAPFLHAPSEGFAAGAILSPRRVLMTGRAQDADAVAGTFAEVSGRGDVALMDGAEACRLMPLLRRDHAVAVMVENDAADIDVHALHHGYLRLLRERGGRLQTGCEVTALEREGDSWALVACGRRWRAPVVVNAAGAWADELAAMAGASFVGLTPKRRTALIVDGPGGAVEDSWPMVVDIHEQFYLKPDAGRLLISPADETPSPPCDAQPEEIDVAICIDRIETAFDVKVERVLNKWAGLRSFVADKCPVVGFDVKAPGFFWLAGQGGYGIQSAPAAARLAAALARGRDAPADIVDQGVDVAALSPRRAGLNPQNRNVQ